MPCANPWLITGNAALAETLLARCREGGLGQAIVLPDVFLPKDPGASSLPGVLPDILACLQQADANEARRLAQDLARHLVDEVPRAAPAAGLVHLALRVLPAAALIDGTARGDGQEAASACPDIRLLGVCGA